jgi:DNA-binding beta-propeller fold protein YncE
MRTGAKTWFLALLAFAVLVLSTATAAWGIGGLSHKPGTAGCISTTGSLGACADGRRIGGLRETISPDGRNLYIASYAADSVSIFDRNPATGALRQAPGRTGCIVAKPGKGGCALGRSFEGPEAVALSPDGKTAYVASEDTAAVAIFDRNPTTGALTQRAGAAGCVSETGTGGACQQGAGIAAPADVAVSPDGKNLYVASGKSDSVAIFDRDPATGALTQAPGAAGCLSGLSGESGCRHARAVDSPVRVIVTSDGGSVYLASFEPAGRRSVTNVAIFDRDPATGALTQKPGAGGCISNRPVAGACQEDKALGFPAGIAASPDGRNVYVGAAFAAAMLAILDRDPATGALTPKSGRSGCVSRTSTCNGSGPPENANGVAVSPDGRSVYAVSGITSSVTIFNRDPATGALKEKPGAAGCIASPGEEKRCRTDDGLTSSADVVLSPDGRNVYVSGAFPGTVSIFSRSTR